MKSNLRLSSEPIHSDLIAKGGADLIISLEPMEALRYMEYLKEDGWIVTSSVPFVNIPNYPALEEVLSHVQAFEHHVLLDVEQLAKESKTKEVTHEMVNIARFMRNKGYEFNNEHPNNEAIVRDIRLLAGEDSEVDLSAITTMRSDHRANGQQRMQKRTKQQMQKYHSGRKNVKGARPQQRQNQHK